jgi:hypothetical protein
MRQSCSRQRIAWCLGIVVLSLSIGGCRRPGVSPGASGGEEPSSPKGMPNPALRFTDVTAAAGIAFRHENGAEGRKYMPETMGSGCAFLDFDNDGWEDILLINGQPWSGVQVYGRRVPAQRVDVQERHPRRPNTRTPEHPNTPTMALYRNDGTGHFQDVTAAVGLDVPLYGMGVAVGDWDNDGFDDLAVTALGGVRLFHNRLGRRFEEVPLAGSESSRTSGDATHSPLAARPGRLAADTGWPTSAAWLDYDRDGRLDLFVCHYVLWSPDTDVYWSLDGVHKSYTTPEKYTGESCRLYRNLGGGRFVDVTERAGILSSRSKALGVAVCDYDGDGWPDLIVSNDTEPTLVYHNQGDGTFQEAATELGVAVAESGKPKAGMGIDTGDDRNTGEETILITNWAGEQISLYRKDTSGHYLDFAAPAGVGLPSQRYLGFGALFFDADLDGWLDILVANGHVMDDIERRNTGVTYAERPLLFRNERDGRYREVGEAIGPAFSTPRVGRGAACGDYDNDGDPDLLLTENGGPARLLRNDANNEHGWVKVQLRGNPSNRDALGARVQVHAGGTVMTRGVKSGSSYLSASDRRLTFGLGRAAQVDQVEIQWPSGAVQTLGPVERNRWLRISEGRSGSVAIAH